MEASIYTLPLFSMFNWHHMPARRTLILHLLALLAAFSSLPGQVSSGLVPDAEGTEIVAERLRLKWEMEGVQSALESGFLSVADTLSQRLLDNPGLSEGDRHRLLNNRLQIALLTGNLPQATEVLRQLRESGADPDPVLEAYTVFFTEPATDWRALLDRLESAPLDSTQLAWVRFLEALQLSREGELDAASEAFRLAALEAPNDLVRDQFELVRLKETMASGRTDQVTISALRESTRSMRGERGGFEAARLLAIALSETGQRAEALEVLNSQLTLPGLRESGLRSEFLLLMGSIAGPASARGRLALREIISEEGSLRHQSMALTLLAQSVTSPQDRELLLQDLDAWLNRAEPHPLADRFLAYKAYFAAATGDFDSASSSAQQLLDRFPASSFVPNALRLLAYVSWSQTPPRYRTAADFLNRLRQRFPTGEDSLEAGILIADCYFLNGDFASASDMYGTILGEAPPELASDLFYQRALSEVGAGRVQAAAAMIDAIRRDPRVTEEAVWRAEWNLLDYMRRNEMFDEAYRRIQDALSVSGLGNTGISPALALRFRWLDARLTLEAGSPAEASLKAARLLEEITTDSFGLDQGLLRQLRSHLLLLQGEAEIASGNRDGGITIFASLRQAYPESGPAILSYLVESRSVAASDNLVSAQQSLVDLVDRFPRSEYAPIALWEAALNAEQRGLNVHLQEAISILERLVSSYPRHELVYYARLKQGDLARRLNDFPTALLLYERLLAQYRDHPERYRAELSRADCLMALGSEDPDRFDQAAVIYERNCLLPAAPLPVRTEAGFKWAHSLRQHGDRSGSEAVFWLLYDRFIKDEDLSQAIVHSEQGRYWMARILLELGTMLVERGDAASARQIYQTLLQLNLPGSALARARLEALQPED